MRRKAGKNNCQNAYILIVDTHCENSTILQKKIPFLCVIVNKNLFLFIKLYRKWHLSKCIHFDS